MTQQSKEKLAQLIKRFEIQFGSKKFNETQAIEERVKAIAVAKKTAIIHLEEMIKEWESLRTQDCGAGLVAEKIDFYNDVRREVSRY